MTDALITCPTCATKFPLTESLAAPMLAATRRDFETRLAAAERAIAAREAAVEAAQAGVAAEVEAKLATERGRLVDEEGRKARAAVHAEVAGLRETLRAQDGKLAVAQAAQAEFMRRSRELEDARRELDLNVEKRVGAEVAAARERARIEAEEASRLRVAEKEATITAMQKQIEELKRRAEQGSQQIQGEVLELDLENRLRARFASDRIEAVAKGVSGADVVQHVICPAGKGCGAILWETKRTKAWSDLWIPKLKADQRTIGAEVALLVSETLPKGLESFDAVDGVWVVSQACAVPLAAALRQGLMAASSARLAREGQASKMEMIYDYLTGPRFRHRIETIVERFRDMSEDLERERKAMTKLWNKREMQIQAVVDATVGMYGDMQGIAGKALGEIEGLDLPLLDAPDGPAAAAGRR